MEITPRLRQHIEQKVQRLSRFVNSDARIEVTVMEEQTRSARDRYCVQLTVSNSTHPIRSEVSAVNASMALDLVLDKVTTQLGRHKDRKTSLRRRHTTAVKVLSLSRTGTLSLVEQQQVDEDEEVTLPITQERNEETWKKMLEIHRIDTKPMSEQAVIAEMEAHGLSFYPFFTKKPNAGIVSTRLITA